MTDWICRPIEGSSDGWIESAKLSLPFCPQSIDVAVKQEEQRITRRSADAGNETTKARVCGAMWISL